MKSHLILAVLATTLSLSLQAQWSGEGDLAYSKVSGNSENNSLSFGIETLYETGDWQHSGEFDTYSANQGAAQTAESYRLDLKTRYTFNRRSYSFGNARYLNDRFSGYEYQASVAGGFGRDFIDDGITFLDAEAGIGYRVSEPEGIAGKESEVIFLLTSTWERILTDTTHFESDWRVESGGDNTFLQSELALEVAVFQALSLRMAYSIKHNTQVPLGRKHTDTKTTVGLNYAF